MVNSEVNVYVLIRNPENIGDSIIVDIGVFHFRNNISEYLGNGHRRSSTKSSNESQIDRV